MTSPILKSDARTRQDVLDEVERRGHYRRRGSAGGPHSRS